VRRLFRYTACPLALLLILPAVAFGLPSLSANPANKLVSRGIDPLQYDPATHCTGKTTKGASALVGWLQRNAAGVSWGTYRCEMWSKNTASLHAEGRAVDWHPASKADAMALIKLLLAPDRTGNPVALARRMGVQGLIYDCKQWYGNPDGTLGEYSYCYGANGKRKKNIDPTQAHMDHVHIELNRRGAALRTTFWDANVTYPIDPQPLPEPLPQQPLPVDPVPTAPASGGSAPWDEPSGGAYYPHGSPR
jgi:hypothetical protein